MFKYKNEESFKKQIMEESRHLFIYGYDDPYRSNFLQTLKKDYPFKINSDKPIAVYMDSFGIPKTNTDFKDKDPIKIFHMSKQYLYFSIARKILEKSIEEIDKNILNTKLSKLFTFLNRISNETNDENKEYTEIKTIDDSLNEIIKSQGFYYQNYNKYINNLTKEIEPDTNILLSFLPLEYFINAFKSSMNINSFF